MKAKSGSVASYLGSIGPFYRSVSLQRDRDDASAVRGYVLTPWLERVATEIFEGLLPGSRRRAWRITGDFGVGKSALALALLRALEPGSSDPSAPMDQLAARINGGLPRMYPLILSGAREGLAFALEAAIADALKAEELSLDAKSRRVIEKGDPFRAVTVLRDALIRSGRYDGLLIVIDEMGKFLEAAAANPDTGDVFRLQELAEDASRSRAKPLGLLLILHQGFQSYSEDSPAAIRSEWAKVAERFDELVFDHPLSHTSALLSAALHPNAEKLPAKILKKYRDVELTVADLGWFGPRSGNQAHLCYPLHPAAVPVLARFFAAYGQNERSLFGFAATEEANGLRAFAARSVVDDGFYGIDQFFDYVSTSFGHRLVARGGAGDWDRIRSVLEGASDKTAVETAVLKTIGILNLIDAPDLIANQESLRACLAPAHSSTVVDRAIEQLRKNGVLFERVGRSGFRLWTSHRVDLSLLWKEADKAVPASSVAKDLSKVLSTAPIRPFLLARRHSIETGVTRRFPIRMVPATALASNTFEKNADGSIFVVLSANTTEHAVAMDWATEATSDCPDRLVIVAPLLPALKPLAVDLLRHRWMEANALILREDAHASAEVERRIADLQSRLVDQLEATFGVAGAVPAEDVIVFRDGIVIDTPTPIHLIVSDMCDDLYSSGPLVHNELINRHTLTSAASKGRQSLIDAMFDRSAVPEMGFTGSKNPPERALYLSVLKRGQVHVETDGTYGLTIPAEESDRLRLRPTLQKIEAMIAGGGERVGLSNIYATVKERPYGVRAGLAPLLLAVILVANRHRIALFERGTYCPKLDSQAFMRILKAPENFSVQWVALEGVRADVYQRMATVLGGDGAEQGLMAVVAPMVKFGAGLSFYAQRSTDLRTEAQAVRDCLLRTRSPVNLVFEDLPKACGVDAFDHAAPHDATRAKTFVDRLAETVDELRCCYPSLLERMRNEVRAALSVDGDLRDALQQRAAPLLFRIKEQELRTFVQRISDRALADDAWTEALGGALVVKPPTRWLAQDVAIWRAKLEEIASRFTRLEAVAFGTGPTKKDAVRLALTHIDGRERITVISLEDETKEEGIYLRGLIKTIEKNGVSPARLIARLTERFITETSEADLDQNDEAAVS